MQQLHHILDAALKSYSADFYKSRVPAYVYANLREGFRPRPYQQEALGRFDFFWNDYHHKPEGVPTQLLYHMATGSGKTLVMAGLIIYLYEHGYRNFLFFVNSTNIIEKTRANFLDAISAKYLFADRMAIGDKPVRMKEVDHFQAANPDDINVVFSTIQGLHSRLNTPKENSLTYDDFEETKIVLISDEAHHINAETKKKSELNAEEAEELRSWEDTVNRVFHANKDNVLLEFTATIDLSVPKIARKYSDKLLFDYPLKQFRVDGYSKEVKVLQADLPPLERAIQGVLLSQYRRKLFESRKQLIKPIILFKSRTIKESQQFFDEFITGIKNLKVSDLEKIRTSHPDAAIKNAFRYLAANNISLENLITELKQDFSEEKLISVNSKNDSEAKQLAINSLEDEANEYRAVFAVDKLNEGWDVLNLFDIVRLYDTRDAQRGKPGKTTMAEAQLIGRGARYCPFRISDDQPYFERKFDDDPAHELRICEVLYYHSAYNPRYIQELNMALKATGIKPEQAMERPRKRKLAVKETPNSGVLVADAPRRYNRQTYHVSLEAGYTKAIAVFGTATTVVADTKKKTYNLADLGGHIIRKAINKSGFYTFSNLSKHFPALTSVSEFIASDEYLGAVKLDISGLPEQIENLTPRDKLEAAVRVLENMATAIAAETAASGGRK
ncbi:DEAD/DEAH box helicase family protein [Parapedobacter sp. 10938]|uniref:DEAD/DEAH box helicase family protein n=1 Tax=Parapedobacter flavus TaxID=3110225 RepID=UPI002DB96AC3|nr:DEAD/DEAH box helicase family protein [Parapedobacter sp. 10938]MEC3879044.1 DEAD/DEAH box helicase family protein [Parapedobacter sp. 10938]